jgi:multiple sugar transport system ATP-binding protein
VIGGKVVNDMQPKERDIAMVFQNYALYPHMTVRDNMAFSMLLAKRPRAEIDDASTRPPRHPRPGTDLLDRYPAPALRRPAASAWRWAAASCAIRRSSSFDEPLSNLDAKLRVAMRTELKELHQRLKTTSIYVTARPDRGHDRWPTRSWGCATASCEQRGKPLELYDRPAEPVRRRASSARRR